MKDYIIDKMVKIAGTEHDRRRKLTNSQIKSMQSKYSKGVSLYELSKEYNVAQNTVHYHVDEEYKKFHNQRRKQSTQSRHNKEAVSSRIEYKKSIMSAIV